MVLTTLNIRLKSLAILDTSQINLKLGIFTDFNEQQCRRIFANWSLQKTVKESIAPNLLWHLTNEWLRQLDFCKGNNRF